jgi:uncharacterized protein with HEPN domain
MFKEWIGVFYGLIKFTKSLTAMSFIWNIIWNDAVAKNFKFILEKISTIIKDISTHVSWYKSNGHLKYQSKRWNFNNHQISLNF